MDQSRRRLLHLGLASAASGLAVVPAAGLAKGRHGAGRHAALHAGGHRSGHHDQHLARLDHHHHGRVQGTYGVDARPVQQAAVDLGAGPRRVKFHNLHTDEKLDAVFWENGQYVPDALHAVNRVLRDFRTGDMHQMDPGLLNLLVALNDKTETSSPFYVISGYRSPKTNALLRDEGGAGTGVAKKSLHMQGQAIDIRLADVNLAYVHKAALSLGRGGVGYYPTSDFVHVDVGPVRQWSGV
jgi:uncharacterized protein YcbK (DUF882 family)